MKESKPIWPLVDYGESRGLTKAQSYVAAAEGVIPTVRIGRLLMVPVEAADRKLGIAPSSKPREMEAA